MAPMVDPSLGVTVRLRRDLPGYNVSRARRSPRQRWSLPVDIQWQSECIMKYLGQNCACCDVIAGDMSTASETRKETSPLIRPAGPRGHDTIYASVDVMKGGAGPRKMDTKTFTETSTTVRSESTHGYSQTTDNGGNKSITSEIDDLHKRLSPFGLDMVQMAPFSTPPGGTRKGRRIRRQIISTTDMLNPSLEPVEENLSNREPGGSPAAFSPFDIMRSHLGVDAGTAKAPSSVKQSSSDTSQGAHVLGDIREEESLDIESTSKSDQ